MFVNQLAVDWIIIPGFYLELWSLPPPPASILPIEPCIRETRWKIHDVSRQNCSFSKIPVKLREKFFIKFKRERRL